MSLATGWRFESANFIARAGKRRAPKAAGASFRLTAANGAPLTAGRYLLDAETPEQNVPVLTIDVDTECEEVVHAVELDFGGARRRGPARLSFPSS